MTSHWQVNVQVICDPHLPEIPTIKIPFVKSCLVGSTDKYLIPQTCPVPGFLGGLSSVYAWWMLLSWIIWTQEAVASGNIALQGWIHCLAPEVPQNELCKQDHEFFVMATQVLICACPPFIKWPLSNPDLVGSWLNTNALIPWGYPLGFLGATLCLCHVSVLSWSPSLRRSSSPSNTCLAGLRLLLGTWGTSKEECWQDQACLDLCIAPYYKSFMHFGLLILCYRVWWWIISNGICFDNHFQLEMIKY